VSNDEAWLSEPDIDLEKIGAATEEDIARWKKEDGFDDDSMWGEPRLVLPVSRVRRIREGLGLSQEAFAERYRLSLRTIQDWEQHRRQPDGPARVLLFMIEKEPEVIARTLASVGSSRNKKAAQQA